MRPVAFLATAIVLGGCLIHRAPGLPASIPAVPGDPTVAFVQRYIDVAVGTGAPVAPRKCLFAHYQLAYGEAGRPSIPAKSELIFDVELMAVADTMPRAEPTPRGQTAPPPQCPTWADVSGRR